MRLFYLGALYSCFAIALLLPAQVLAQDELKLQSGVEQPVMIELFTSEGCSSCPPAEQYLNSFASHPQLWTKFIPLAFHVDYWDYLGWKDRYSRAAYSERQKEYARQKRLSAVYTPAFVVNGKGWRPSSMVNHEPMPPLHKAGRLKLNLTPERGKGVFSPEISPSRALVLNLAILGMDISTKIEAGENRGRTSRHEFVVLSHVRHSPASQTDDRVTWNFPLPVPRGHKAPQYALVAWVSEGSTPEPLQTVGGYLPPEWYQ